MQIDRRGDFYALVLPAELVERFGLYEGQEINTAAIEAVFEAHREEREQVRQAALKRISENRWQLPEDWKFDREEANAR